MKISGIYKIQSKEKPEKCYIGSSVNIKYRKRRHLRQLSLNKHPNIKLQNHYNKYDKTDLQFTILLGCKKEDLIKNEQFFIDAYKPLFNICPNAGNHLGRKCSKETIDKIRKNSIGKKNRLGMKNSIESNKKRSISLIGNKNSLGIKQSSEHKRKISEALRGKKKSIETRNKHSETNKRLGIKPPNRKGIKWLK
jgi:group I intron endonuclease